jgi:hypothetical protein
LAVDYTIHRTATTAHHSTATMARLLGLAPSALRARVAKFRDDVERFQQAVEYLSLTINPTLRSLQTSEQPG